MVNKMSLYSKLLEEFKQFDLGIFNEEEQKRRIAICESCDQFNAENHRCKVCGCSIANVVLLTQNTCYLGKWIGSSEQLHQVNDTITVDEQ